MATEAAETTGDDLISTVSLNGAQLTINKKIGRKEIPIRDVQIVELRSSADRDVMKVYIGTIDHERKSIFSRASVMREYVGETDSARAASIRNALAALDVPIFEFKI